MEPTGRSTSLAASFCSRRQRAGAVHLEFRERAHVDQRDALAHRPMLGADRFECRAAPERGNFDRRRSRGREPVRTLPAEFVAVDGAGGLQCGMQRTAPRVAAGVGLVRGPRDVIVAAVAFDGPRVHEIPDRMRRAEAAHVEGPQVHSRIAVDDPVGHHPTGAARRRDAGREAAAEVEVVELGREADDRLAVGGDRYRAIDHLPDADVGQRRDPRRGRLGDRREAFEIRLQQARDRSPRGCRRRPRAACSPPSRRRRARRVPA